METLEVRSADRILNSSLKLFSDKGYDATSVREICESAGITKPTLYHFYGSKEGVYRALVDGTLDRFRSDVDRALESPAGAAHRLKAVARTYFRAAREKPELVRFVFALIHNPPASAPVTDFPRFYTDVTATVGRAVEDGVAAGEFTPGRLDLRLLALMGALAESVCGALIFGRPDITPELADALVDTVIAGWRPAGVAR